MAYTAKMIRHQARWDGAMLLLVGPPMSEDNLS